MVDSTAAALATGREPGRPRQTGQTWVLGSAPNAVGQPQNIFDAVSSSTCVSSPMTGSYRATTSSMDSTDSTAEGVGAVAAGAFTMSPAPGGRRPPFARR